MLQLVYISTATGHVTMADITRILARSRYNNTADGITGLLFFDGLRFLQALEGPEPAVEGAFARIRRDARHRAVVKLSQRIITEREFGAWAMAAPILSDHDSAALLARVATLARNAAPNVRAQFESFARVRRAA